VFLAYASSKGRTLIDRDYLPRGWCEDRTRRDEAGISPHIRFATKPAQALTMILRAVDAGLPARWVTADEAYGQDSKFRIGLQQARIGYVVAIPRSQKIPTTAGSARADYLAANAPVLGWKRRSCGDGVKGPRLYDWAVASLPDTGTAEHGFARWLLIRRSITRPTELAYYLCYGPTDTKDECRRHQPVPELSARCLVRHRPDPHRVTSAPDPESDHRAWPRSPPARHC
jgi:SRSO17 transposase